MNKTILKMKQKEFIKVDLNNEVHCSNLLKLLNDYMEDDIGTGKPMPKELGPQIIDGLKEHPVYLGFFACVEDEFAALANCNLNFSTWQAKPLINIHDFIVSPDFRKQGVGLFLLKEIERYATQKGYCRINLEVRHDNYNAQNLYLKAGFNECVPRNYFWEKRMLT
ncbi:GNAT family N-acetyltransferase [Mariniphaga sediminis]|uniref:GNAT family N-acetyltransferase n=2 Tax=Mariniphaga sediminis TaxID=1628158 RepID=A0A399D0R1_9BACT|nr:GNAT family N-acetyltransferase [Mariniphaga sediminis]